MHLPAMHKCSLGIYHCLERRHYYVLPNISRGLPFYIPCQWANKMMQQAQNPNTLHKNSWWKIEVSNTNRVETNLMFSNPRIRSLIGLGTVVMNSWSLEVIIEITSQHHTTELCQGVQAD